MIIADSGRELRNGVNGGLTPFTALLLLIRVVLQKYYAAGSIGNSRERLTRVTLRRIKYSQSLVKIELRCFVQLDDVTADRAEDAVEQRFPLQQAV